MDTLPSYARTYAPLVWLANDEVYFPSDIAAQVKNTVPYNDYQPIIDPPSPLDLTHLDLLNSLGDKDKHIYLTTTVDITADPAPEWLEGVKPDSSGKTNDATTCAIISNDHGDGMVDIFYMYFYAYNKGNTVVGREFGNHVGDWEHNMIRFQDGVPQTIYYSQHGNGEAFRFDVVEKRDDRPVVYSSLGSHANYATDGPHARDLPNTEIDIGLLIDETSKGTLWDCALSAYEYKFDPTSQTFEAADDAGTSPVGAMLYRGHWGDKQYRNEDPKQDDFLGVLQKYTDGPTGPIDKKLDREGVCPAEDECEIKDALEKRSDWNWGLITGTHLVVALLSFIIKSLARRGNFGA